MRRGLGARTEKKKKRHSERLERGKGWGRWGYEEEENIKSVSERQTGRQTSNR